MAQISTTTPSTAALSIGPHRIDSPVALAPMSGITDAPFRRMVARFGAGWVVSEMVPSDDLALGEEEARLRAEGDGLDLHVVQIAGCEAHWMAEGAKVAAGAGAKIIDINMGCPAKRVTGGYAGSALMRDLDHAENLIKATVAAVDVPVTLKMRLGWDEASINAAELARRAEAAGVHGTRAAEVIGLVGVDLKDRAGRHEDVAHLAHRHGDQPAHRRVLLLHLTQH